MHRMHAQASPSVTLEKGVPRLRPTRPVRATDPFRSNRHGKRPAAVYIFPTDGERRTTAILAAVAFVTLIAVCLALYLLNRSSRWGILSLRLSTHSELRSAPLAPCDRCITPLPTPRALVPHTPALVALPRDSGDSYLSYLPHSGFHNQRIALENALVLSHILNRTLLIPPILLGDPPIRYRPSINLQVDVALYSKASLEHCAFVSDGTHIPADCADLGAHVHVPWDWLIDLQSLVNKYGIKILAREDLSDAFLVQLGVNHSGTYFLRDTDVYQYRLYDSLTDNKPLGARYMSRVNLPTLATLSNRHRLLQFGTLFGTTRIRLSDPVHIALRGAVRRAMVFSNPQLLAIADNVRDSPKLGGDLRYAAVHLRLGDGVFADAEVRALNMRSVWWKLVRELGLSDEDAAKVESRRPRGGRGVFLPPPTQVRDVVASRVPHPPPPPLGRSRECQRKALHPLLGIPLYVATDKPNHHALSIFRHSFPCLYFLHNFTSYMAQLEMISMSSNGTSSTSTFANADHSATAYQRSLAPFLPPFLDAIIASKARVVMGTPGSTFSRFVEDVLWRAYHHWDIVQRG